MKNERRTTRRVIHGSRTVFKNFLKEKMICNFEKLFSSQMKCDTKMNRNQFEKLKAKIPFLLTF